MKRLLLVGLALVLGIGGVFTLVSYVQASDDRARAGQELTAVYVLTEPVPIGRTASQVEPLLERTMIPVELRTPTAVTDPELLKGLVTTADLVAGEQLLADRFGQPQERTVAGGQVAVPNGMVEASITLTPDRAVGGQVKPGDQVAVMASFDFDDRETFSNLLFHNVLVINVQTADPEFVDGDEDQDQLIEARSRQIPGSSLLLTFALTPPQAERLVFSNEYGSIHLAREAPLTPTDETDLVTIDNLFEDQSGPATAEPQPNIEGDVEGDETAEGDDGSTEAGPLAARSDDADSLVATAETDLNEEPSE